MSTKKVLAKCWGPYYLAQDGTRYQAIWVDKRYYDIKIGFTRYLAKRTNLPKGELFVYEIYPIIVQPSSYVDRPKTWYEHGREMLEKVDHFKRCIECKF